MSTKKFISNNTAQTQTRGKNFAHEIFAAGPRKTATVLALSGDLGAGKTTFLQGFAEGLGIEEVVNSPTFIIMKKFQIQNPKSQINSKFQIPNSKFTTFYHVDLYRLEDQKDFEFFDFQEIISHPENIIAIEWPEKITSLLPRETIKLEFNHLEENKREVSISDTMR